MKFPLKERILNLIHFTFRLSLYVPYSYLSLEELCLFHSNVFQKRQKLQIFVCASIQDPKMRGLSYLYIYKGVVVVLTREN